jgi:hypothetical protein
MSAARATTRFAVALGLVTLLFALPLATAHASDDETADSRVGVLLAAACGLSLKAALISPVPWAGIAAVTCIASFLDAALSPDESAPQPPPPPPPTP